MSREPVEQTGNDVPATVMKGERGLADTATSRVTIGERGGRGGCNGRGGSGAIYRPHAHADLTHDLPVDLRMGLQAGLFASLSTNPDKDKLETGAERCAI